LATLVAGCPSGYGRPTARGIVTVGDIDDNSGQCREGRIVSQHLIDCARRHPEFFFERRDGDAKEPAETNDRHVVVMHGAV
jgi:hypothetical protein